MPGVPGSQNPIETLEPVTFQFNFPKQPRIKAYIPIDPTIDYSYPNYLYLGNKYRTLK
jgi:hypothetical protein